MSGGWRARAAAAGRTYRAWRERLRGSPAEPLWRAAVLVTGLAIVAAGVVLLVIPGPGWLLIFAGLGVLAAEYAWAHRLLGRVRGLYERVKAASRRRADRKAGRRVERGGERDERGPGVEGPRVE